MCREVGADIKYHQKPWPETKYIFLIMLHSMCLKISMYKTRITIITPSSSAYSVVLRVEMVIYMECLK